MTDSPTTNTSVFNLQGDIVTLARTLGRVEGKVDRTPAAIEGIEGRQTRLEGIVSQFVPRPEIDKIECRVGVSETIASNKAVIRTLAVLWGLLTAVLGFVVPHFWK